MTNDLTTLDGSLDEMKDQLIDELDGKGVTATFDSSTGLLGLIGEISNIQQGGTSCPKLVQGTFTTGSTRNTTGSVSLSYSGNGYPICCVVYVDGGAYNSTSGGNTTWYNSTNRYDVGFYSMTKAQTNTTPSWNTSSSNCYGVVTIIYKNSTTTSTQYTRTSTMTATTYSSSDTNASASTVCVRFKGSKTALSYYIGNSGSSSIGLAPSTKYAYIVIYSE